MPLTRRQALATAGAALVSTLAKPAIAATEPIRIGYLPALTVTSVGPQLLGATGAQHRPTPKPRDIRLNAYTRR